MDAFVAGEVDAIGGDGDRSREAVHEPCGRPDAREHRPVVVGVGVDVEHARVLGDGPPDGIEGRAVTALREVGDGLQETAHRATVSARRASSGPLGGGPPEGT
jgi:hypothetical protein